ncbi:TPA: hypothetical protein ACQQ5N_002766 [Pseudomonas aeruginosa]
MSYLEHIRNMAERIKSPSFPSEQFNPSRQDAVRELREQFRIMFDVMTPQELQKIIPQLIQEPAYSNVRDLLAPEVQQLSDALRSSSQGIAGTPLAYLTSPTPTDENRDAQHPATDRGRA